MSPRTKAQFEALRRKSRQRILSAALKLFARRGYAETTIDAIARSAGISKGLLYNYFSGKGEILETLLVESLRDALPTIDDARRYRDPTAAMETLIHRWVGLIKSESDLMRLGVQLHTSSAYRTLVRKKMGTLYEMFVAGLIEIFHRLGSRDPELDVYLLGSILDGINLNYIAAPGAFPIDRLEKRLIRMYCGKGRAVT